MDGQRFDALARQLGLGLSRRKLIRLLFGGAGALTAVTLQKDVVRAAGSGEPCGTPPNCDAGLTCVGGFCGSPCDIACGPCQECWAFGELGGCISMCDTGQRCCEGTCSECCSDAHCTPSDLGPCCGARCDGGQCLLFSDDAKCVTAGECFRCDGSTGTCEFACGNDQVCCSGECLTGDCCGASDCTATNQCYRATCTLQNTCQYSPAHDLCLEDCTVCDNNGYCVDLCNPGEICCPGELDGCALQCCDDADCTDTNECYVGTCNQGICQYAQSDARCEEACTFCSVDGACEPRCTTGQVCCEDTCYDGVCCDDIDCDYVPCARVTCSDSHQCGAVSLCPPTGPGTYLCCAVGSGQDYCYGTADIAEFECCSDEDCIVSAAEESCFVPLCMNGMCQIGIDDSACGYGECCCDDGSCSGDCCDVPSCDDDYDCPGDSICCAGFCREIECCIDDILTGGNPNDRCPGKCTCSEGLCVDEHQNHCRHCTTDKECPNGECCCRNGACSEKCCHDGACKHDHDCPKGECCCKDGACSDKCCDHKPDKPRPDKPDKPSTGTADTLPSTGSGPESGTSSWVSGAALAAGAAALFGAKKLQESTTPAEEERS